MEIALILMREIGVMTLLILLGAYCKKKGIFNSDTANKLSVFLVYFVLPVLLVNTLQRDKDSAALPAFWTALLLSGMLLALSVAASILVFRPRKDSEEYKIERLAAVLPNCGFMGIPLLLAVCSEDSILLCTAVLGVFQLLMWCWAAPMLESKKPSVKKVLLNPGTLAFAVGLLLFLLEIRLPEMLLSFMSQLSGLNTPLSLLMIGIFLADTSPREAFLNPSVYKAVFFRNLAIPLASVLLIHAFGFTYKFGMEFSISIVILMSCSSAASALLLPVRAGKGGAYAAQMVAASAFFSVITLPFVVFVADSLFQGG